MAEGKKNCSMFLNIDVFTPIHRTHRYFKKRSIDISKIDVQTILPIPNPNQLNMLQNRKMKQVMRSVGRIFRYKLELLLPLLVQLEASLKLKGKTT